MSTLISLKNITFKHNIAPIFDGVDFSINEGDKVAVAGHNGCGKSTLLNILSGEISNFEGNRSTRNGLKLEVVEQYLNPEIAEFSLLEALLAKLPAEDKLTQGYLAEILLEDLFFEQSEFDTKVKNLSGGGQNRLMIARSIITSPDLVLMDEPTNHLDLKTLLYIEDYLKNKAKFSLMVISHDIRFLSNVCNKTVVLRDQCAYNFSLPYQKALDELKVADEVAKKRLALEEKEIARIKKSAKRLAIWGREHDNEDLAKKAKSMEKRASKLEDDKTFVSRGNPYELNLGHEKISSKIALQIEDSDIHFGEKLESDLSNKLFEIKNLTIRSGEKVALLGANGCGKSTLIDWILRNFESEYIGRCFKTAPNLKVGLFDQEQLVLNPKESIFKNVLNLTDCDDLAVKNCLIRAGFQYDRHQTLIGRLSGGEKSRVIFCVLYLRRPNFLILDEPTNHIDLDGKNELAESLKSSEVTTLLTGHDRHFIEQVATRYILIENGALRTIEDPKEYYESLLKGPSTKSETLENTSPEKKGRQHDDLLELIMELEEKLAADQARKPKFQKPKLQKIWKEELEDLYSELERI